MKIVLKPGESVEIVPYMDRHDAVVGLRARVGRYWADLDNASQVTVFRADAATTARAGEPTPPKSEEQMAERRVPRYEDQPGGANFDGFPTTAREAAHAHA